MQTTYTVELLTGLAPLWELENSFLAEIGEEPLDSARRERLKRAVEERKIVFFVAKHEGRPVGICSVSPCFSTFACLPCGMFDDFFILPAYRHQGIARLLAAAAREWCAQQGYASLSVGCCEADTGMYAALGFETRLGAMLACNL